MARGAKAPPRSRRRLARKPKSATARDVAAAVGVSVMTVSRYVNGHLSRLSGETQKKIARAIEELNYRPHQAARGLRLSRRLSIGMVLVDPSPTFLADPFITHLVAGLSNFLSHYGYALSIQSVPPHRVAEALPFRRIGTDGVCVMPSGSADQRIEIGRLLQQNDQPVVVFQEYLEYLHNDTCRIVQDDFGGAHRLARHLLEQGARVLAMLVPEREWPAMVERERGVRAALHRSGAALAVVTCGDESFDITQTSLARHMREAGIPDAIVAGNDQMALAAMHLLKRQAIDVPGRVMVTGFNAFEFRLYGDPLLTSVRSPAYTMGERGGQELVRRLTEGSFSASLVRLPVRFEPGRTTRIGPDDVAGPIGDAAIPAHS